MKKQILGFSSALGLGCLALSVSGNAFAASAPKKVTAPAVVDSEGNASSAPAHSSGEDWKGKPSGREFTLGGILGLGLVEPQHGFGMSFNVAKKIINSGFIPDVNNQVFLEAEVGPTWVSGGSAAQWSAHLRWDFQKDDRWTFFAIMGLGGESTSNGLGNNSFVYPRIGGGVFYYLTQNLSIRGEISHELTGVGLSLEF